MKCVSNYLSACRLPSCKRSRVGLRKKPIIYDKSSNMYGTLIGPGKSLFSSDPRSYPGFRRISSGLRNGLRSRGGVLFCCFFILF